MEFPKILDAVRATDYSLWGVARAAHEALGDPISGTGGHLNGSWDMAISISSYLAQYGFDYTPNRLRSLRNVAFRFKPEDQIDGHSFAVHQAAGDPATLNRIIAHARPGTIITSNYIRDVLRAEQQFGPADSSSLDTTEGSTPPPESQPAKATSEATTSEAEATSDTSAHSPAPAPAPIRRRQPRELTVEATMSGNIRRALASVQKADNELSKRALASMGKKAIEECLCNAQEIAIIAQDMVEKLEATKKDHEAADELLKPKKTPEAALEAAV